MIRTLLATTALTAVLTAGAYAQSADTDADATVDTPAANDTVQDNSSGSTAGDAEVNQNVSDDAVTDAGAQDDAAMPADDSSANTQADTSAPGYYTASANQVLISTIMGQTVYNGNGDDAEAIGDVSDIVLAKDGSARAVVIGVGGFLGIGEKQVAVDFSRLNWTKTDDGTRVTMNATSEELQNAPAFDREAVTGEGNAIFGSADSNNANTDTSANANTDTSARANTNTNTNASANANANANTNANDQAATDTEANTPPEDMKPVDPANLSTDDLIGTRVFSEDNQDIGEIDDVIVSADDGTVKAYIVDVGGFLGIGEKPVALGAKDLKVMQDGNGNMSIYTTFSKDELDAQPEYSKDAYAQDPDSVILR